MSHSPEDAGAAEGDYLEGWLATEQQVREGRSWSGSERHSAFLNLGDGHFVDIAEASGFAFPEDGRGLALVDWDHDGDLDLWLRNRTTPSVRFLRNDVNRPQRAVSLLLQGEGPNTGAIGARVELASSGTPWPKQRRTVRAGSGYLSQSSRRLHFGLGDDGVVEAVSVRWPDGSVEQIAGVERPGRYRVRQGSGRAEAEPARGPVRLEAEPVGKLAGTDSSHLVPLGPLPMPELGLTDHAGEAISVTGERERPLLLLAWATWCKPCYAELRELGRNAAKLEEAGLDVLLVSVDTAPEEPTATPDEVRAWLEQNGVPFRSSLASADSVRKLELLHEALVNRVRPLALPSSVLVGPDGDVVVYRRGPCGLEEAMADLELAGVDREARARQTTGGDGLWLRRPRWSDVDSIAGWFAFYGFADDANAVADAAAGPESDRLVLEGERLREEGRLALAEQAARSVLATEPEHPGALALLGLVALETGAAEPAAELLQQAVTADPLRATSWINLSHAQAVLGRSAEAAESARRAVRLQPASADAWHALAAVELAAGRRAEGVRALRESVRLDPTRAESARMLATYLAAPDDPAVRDEEEAAYWRQRAAAMEAAARQQAATASN